MVIWGSGAKTGTGPHVQAQDGRQDQGMPGVHPVPWDPVRNAGPVEQEQGHGSGIGKPDGQPQGYGVEQDGPEPGQGSLAAIGDGTEGIGDLGIVRHYWKRIGRNRGTVSHDRSQRRKPKTRTSPNHERGSNLERAVAVMREPQTWPHHRHNWAWTQKGRTSAHTRTRAITQRASGTVRTKAKVLSTVLGFMVFSGFLSLDLKLKFLPPRCMGLNTYPPIIVEILCFSLQKRPSPTEPP